MSLFSCPRSSSTLVMDQREACHGDTSSPHIMGQGCIGGLGISRERRLVGHRRGTVLVEIVLSGLGNRRLGRGQQVRIWRGGGREGGGGSDLGWRREVVPSSPRRSGGGLTGGGSILSLALSLCLPIRFLSLGSTRIPGTENGAIAYTSA